jgi:hypothetical protein
MVTSQYQPSIQAGNGATVAFNFSFKILATTDLVVAKTDAAGNSSGTLVLGTDYTVTFDPIAETGTVTYTVAPVSGGFSNISRSSNDQQQTSLPRDGVMPAKTVETMLDKLTMLMQEIAYGQTETPVEASGLYASRPVAPTFAMYYTSTDTGTYEKWVPALGRWIQLG